MEACSSHSRFYSMLFWRTLSALPSPFIRLAIIIILCAFAYGLGRLDGVAFMEDKIEKKGMLADDALKALGDAASMLETCGAFADTLDGIRFKAASYKPSSAAPIARRKVTPCRNCGGPKE